MKVLTVAAATVIAILAISWAFAGREDIAATYIAAELVIVVIMNKDEER